MSDKMDLRMSNAAERYDFWDPDITYVIGHQRPDTDSIAAALGYAWYLQQIGQDSARASRTGQPAEQTLYALKRFEQPLPGLLTAVAPTFWHVAQRGATVPPDAPLSDALALLAGGERIVPVVDAERRPLGVVTPLALARAYSLSGVGKGDPQDGAIRATTERCGDLAESFPTFRTRDRLSDHRGALLHSERNQFLVVDDNGSLYGIATQRHILQPPRARLILVDHNELTQAVAGADEAEIVGVLDHHRLGNPPTAAPIPFVVDPVGSTSTLVTEYCRAKRLHPPRGIAGLLLSGILSDTLVFRSPTTGDRDRSAAEWLGRLCWIDVELYGKELLGASPGLQLRTADAILDADRKNYEMGGSHVSIGQVEVTGMQELPERRAELLTEMQARCESEGLALFCLMITDVVTGTSRMLARGDTKLIAALPFSRVSEFEFDLHDMVSRKKQLTPAVLNAIETTV
jgi:manganese-dependent inorganic pyrophosphatase